MTLSRTDLAVETAEELSSSRDIFSPGTGVTRTESLHCGCPVTRIRVATEDGAALLGRPPGAYVTVDLRPLLSRQEPLLPRAAACLSRELRALLPPGEGTALVVGLGNSAMTPDAVGTAALEHLLVTRHLLQAMPRQFAGLRPVASLRPGVLSATGVETLELIRGAAAHIRPAVVIVIDALAARSRHRLCATVQLSDTGLTPGSGVGNHRKAVNARTLRLPVVAVGVPTVIDGAALCGDEDAAPSGLFVTPQAIDRRIRDMGALLGTAITLALQPTLTAADVTALLG